MEYISILVLILTIAVAYFSGISAGVLGIAFAFIFGKFCVGLSAKEIISGFPTSTIFTLMGMTFLFSIARENGTLSNVAQTITKLAKGKPFVLVILFFVLCAALAAIGPGPVAITALVAPIAMATGKEQDIPDVLMAIAVYSGSICGGLTSFSSSGIIAYTLGQEQGVTNYTPVFLSCMTIGFFLFVIFFLLFGGLKLKKTANIAAETVKVEYTRNQKISLIVIFITVVLIAAFRFDTGLTAFTGGAVLLLLKVVEPDRAIRGIAWPTILLIGGMGILVNVMNLSGGISAITAFLSRTMTVKTAPSIMCVIAGLMSSVSSASGVVMPTLIPTIGELAETLGGGVSLSALLASIVVGAHAVTASPLSTIGALCLSSANEKTDKQKLFNQMLAIGFSAIVIAAVLGGLGLFF